MGNEAGMSFVIFKISRAVLSPIPVWLIMETRKWKFEILERVPFGRGVVGGRMPGRAEAMASRTLFLGFEDPRMTNEAGMFLRINKKTARRVLFPFVRSKCAGSILSGQFV